MVFTSRAAQRTADFRIAESPGQGDQATQSPEYDDGPRVVDVHHLEAQGDPARQPGRAFSAAFDAQPIYRPIGRRLLATKNAVNPARLLALHEVPGENWLVSRFRAEAVEDGQRIAFRRAGAWWDIARKRTDWIIVHAPPLEQGGGGALALCRDMDAIVLVVEADRTRLEDVMAARDAVLSEQGNLLGCVMVGVGRDARRFSKLAA